MKSKFFRIKKYIGIPSYFQISSIKKVFPNAQIINKTWNSFDIKIKLQPSPLCELYNVRIVYKNNAFVKVYVVDKKLNIAKNRTKLPHVYNSKTQQLCLFSPSKNEWKSTQYIVDTIIPWTSEWLFNYELWLLNGKWYGGGHNEYPNEELNKIIRNE